MPSADELLFLGVTVGPIRSQVADVFDQPWRRISMPCVGRWSVALATAQRRPNPLDASDLSLLSSLVGYLADPDLDPRALGVQLPEERQELIETDDPFEWTAGVMLALKLGMLQGGNVHQASIRSEVWSARKRHLTRLVEQLRATVATLGQVRYRIADVRDEVRAFGEEAGADEALFLAPPTYRGGYGKMYGPAEATIWPGTQLATAEFDPDELPGLLGPLTDSPALVLVYVQHGSARVPDDWTRIGALDFGKGRTDYLMANHDPGGRRVTTRFDRPAALWPVFRDDEIRPDSQIRMVLVDQATGLHYRDLFVHRLGPLSDVDKCGLMLIDGRVVTAFGLMVSPVRLRRRTTAYLVFAITISSARYARLAKLFMLCVTSDDFRRWLIREEPALQATDLNGIASTAVTGGAEGKVDRGVLTIQKREKTERGYKVIGQAIFRPDSWPDCLSRWLRRWGDKTREEPDAHDPPERPRNDGEAEQTEAIRLEPGEDPGEPGEGERDHLGAART